MSERSLSATRQICQLNYNYIYIYTRIQYNNDNTSDDEMVAGDGAVGRAFSRGVHFKISNIL